MLGQRDVSVPAAFEQAGATWWLENVHDQRGTPEAVLELVARWLEGFGTDVTAL